MSAPQLFQTIDDMKPFVFRITDNRDETLDRYTVVFCDGDYLALSTTGAGFSQWGEAIDPAVLQDWVEAGTADDLALEDLDPQLVSHIRARLNEAYRDFLESPASVIDLSRDDVTENEGTHLSTGQGIYGSGREIFIRREGAPEDDLGPYPSFRDALLQSLPTAYSLAGPEYHSTAF